MHVMGAIQAIAFSADLPNLKSIWHFEDKLPQLYFHYGGIAQLVEWRDSSVGRAPASHAEGPGF